MAETPDSIKIMMLADAGYEPMPLQIKYIKLVNFVKRLKDGEFGSMACYEAKDFLKEIGEW